MLPAQQKRPHHCGRRNLGTGVIPVPRGGDDWGEGSPFRECAITFPCEVSGGNLYVSADKKPFFAATIRFTFLFAPEPGQRLSSCEPPTPIFSLPVWRRCDAVGHCIPEPAVR